MLDSFRIQSDKKGMNTRSSRKRGQSAAKSVNGQDYIENEEDVINEEEGEDEDE